MAGGFDRLSPSRKVVDEILSNGTSLPTGITGFTAKQAYIRYNKWVTPLPPSSSARVAAITATSTSAATSLTIVANPDYARAIRIAATTSQAPTNVVTVTGTDIWGAAQVESITLQAGSSVQDGLLAFKTISSISVAASTSINAGTMAAPASVTVGLSNVFGLDRNLASVSACIRGAVNGTAETTAPILGAPSTSGTQAASSSRSTAKFNTAATSSAGATVEIWYLTDDIVHA